MLSTKSIYELPDYARSVTDAYSSFERVYKLHSFYTRSHCTGLECSYKLFVSGWLSYLI